MWNVLLPRESQPLCVHITKYLRYSLMHICIPAAHGVIWTQGAVKLLVVWPLWCDAPTGRKRAVCKGSAPWFKGNQSTCSLVPESSPLWTGCDCIPSSRDISGEVWLHPRDQVAPVLRHSSGEGDFPPPCALRLTQLWLLTQGEQSCVSQEGHSRAIRQMAAPLLAICLPGLRLQKCERLCPLYMEQQRLCSIEQVSNRAVFGGEERDSILRSF